MAENKQIGLNNDFAELDSSNNNDLIDQFFIFQYLINLINRRKKLIGMVFFSLFSISVLSTIFERIFFPTYQASFKLLISDPIRPPNNSNQNLAFLDIASNRSINDIPTLIEVLKSDLILNKVRGGKIKGLDINLGGGDAFRGEKQAEGMLIVSIYGNSKNNTLNLARSLSERYLEYSVEQKNKRLERGLYYLDKQLPIQKERNDLLNKKIIKYQKDNSLVGSIAEANSIKLKLSEIENYILQTQMQRSKLLSAKEGVLKGNYVIESFSEIIKPSVNQGMASTDGLIYSDSENKLLIRYRELVDEVSLAKTIYTENSKIMKSLESKLEKVKKRVLEAQKLSINNALKLNKLTEEAYISQLDKLNKKYFEQPELIAKYEELIQELKTEQENLIGLREARATFELQMAQNNVVWSLLSEPSINPKPVFPSFRRNLSFGFTAALFFALLVGFIKEKLDNYYHDEDEIKKEFEPVVLGSIPHFSQIIEAKENQDSFKKVIDSLEDTESIFAMQESFSNFYTSLRYLSPDKPIKSISITSSVPAEGKTTNSLFLAKVVSDLGKKVLMIDADMRKPQLHKRLNLNNFKGLSNFLIDKESKWTDYIQKVDSFDNLSIITAGRRPPNTLKLIESEKMKNLIKSIYDDESFDLVIWDCSPIYGLADARILGKYLDGLVLLISCGVVDRKTPKECIEIIKNNKINCLGLLVSANRFFDSQKNSKSYKYYYGQYNTSAKINKNINENIYSKYFKKLTKKIKDILSKFK